MILNKSEPMMNTAEALQILNLPPDATERQIRGDCFRNTKPSVLPSQNWRTSDKDPC
jgi:hypothetical protein